MWIWVKFNDQINAFISSLYHNFVPLNALSIIAGSDKASDMAEDMYRALWSFLIGVIVTVVVSLVTKPRPDSELVGLVRACTPIPSDGDCPLWHRPVFWAVIVAIGFVAVNILFW